MKKENHKKITLILLLICAAAVTLFAGCSSRQPTVRGVPADAPNEVKESVKNAPKDALIGIGKAADTLSLAETVAETRARASISRQLNTMMQEMVRIYRAETELDDSASLSYLERITVSLSRSTLRGSVIICEAQNAGSYWTVVMISKDDAFGEINRAREEAKSADPDSPSIDITVNINQAYDNVVSANVTVD